MQLPTPNTLPAAIAQLRMTQAVYDVAVAKAASAKTDLAHAETAVMELMREQSLTLAGDEWTEVEIKSKLVYSMNKERWNELYERIRITGEFDLLQKRLVTAAVAERMKAGDMLPGVSEVILAVLSNKPKKYSL